MKEAMESLRRRRKRILLLSLGYFLGLLAVGVAVFLKGAGPMAAYGLIALCAAVYLLLVRPAVRRYTRAVRGRFLGFPVNPLMPVTEKTMNPFPEAERVIALARLMRPRG